MLNKSGMKPDKRHAAVCGLFCPACSLFRNGPRNLDRGLSEIFVPEKTFITPPQPS